LGFAYEKRYVMNIMELDDVRVAYLFPALDDIEGADESVSNSA
jgi:hypothetical protein